MKAPWPSSAAPWPTRFQEVSYDSGTIQILLPGENLTLTTGKPFVYRYAKHPEARQTLVLLTGGIGLSDLFYLHFSRFARDFSVITFDYPLAFGDVRELSDAAAELLQSLGARAHVEGMQDFLLDAETHMGMEKAQFVQWEDRVLLIRLDRYAELVTDYITAR